MDTTTATMTIETDDLYHARIFRKIYAIISTIQNPFITRVFSISPRRIVIEKFTPLLTRALTPQETIGIRSAIMALESAGIILTRIVRHHIGMADGKMKLYLFTEAGISSSNPYKWKTKPASVGKIRKLMRQCDFDAYISGVYKLSEITKCAARRFFMANTARYKKELKKKMLDSIRDEFRVRHYLQTGNDMDKISTPMLRKFLRKEGTRLDLEDLLRNERENRNRARLKQTIQHDQKKKNLILTKDTSNQEILQMHVMDPILYQERALGEILKDSEYDYRVLLVKEKNGTIQPALYENRIPEIMYRCIDDCAWQDYLPQQDYFFHIRTFDGGRYLIPKMTLGRVMVIESSDDIFRVVSREAIQEMDFMSRNHCQDGSETRLYRPDMTETRRIERLLAHQQRVTTTKS